MVASNHNITREHMDAFSLTSHDKASAATLSGVFKDEILPLQTISYDPRSGVTLVTNFI
jgi:acetyl-CoA acetyltransferase